MIGKLTIDKSSMNISYFLYSIKIIYENHGRISRTDFTNKMSSFIGVPATIKGKENRTSYNKSKMPRYFGLIDVASVDRSGDLVITNRGKLCYKYIFDNGNDVPPEERYSINKADRANFRELIIFSIIYDSFGKNNSGAEQSYTDVEPPKIVFKTIIELGAANVYEICYVLFGLNEGVFDSFEEAVDKIKENRKIGVKKYKDFFEAHKLINIVKDCKVVNIFTDDNIALLTTFKDDDNVVYYKLSDNVNENLKRNFNSMSPVYRPLMLFTKSNVNNHKAEEWVNYAILGQLSDTSLIFKHNINLESIRGRIDNAKFIPSTFEQAVLAAFEHQKQNVYLLIRCSSRVMFEQDMNEYCCLLDRIVDLKSDMHGWSSKAINDVHFYNFLKNNSKKANALLNNNQVRLPSNLHILIKVEE